MNDETKKPTRFPSQSSFSQAHHRPEELRAWLQEAMVDWVVAPSNLKLVTPFSPICIRQQCPEIVGSLYLADALRLALAIKGLAIILTEIPKIVTAAPLTGSLSKCTFLLNLFGHLNHQTPEISAALTQSERHEMAVSFDNFFSQNKITDLNLSPKDYRELSASTAWALTTYPSETDAKNLVGKALESNVLSPGEIILVITSLYKNEPSTIIPHLHAACPQLFGPEVSEGLLRFFANEMVENLGFIGAVRIAWLGASDECATLKHALLKHRITVENQGPQEVTIRDRLFVGDPITVFFGQMDPG